MSNPTIEMNPECGICLTEKPRAQFAERYGGIANKCECSFTMCVDCALQDDNFWVCCDLTCNLIHSKCPQCRATLAWSGLIHPSVTSSAFCMGNLFKRARKQLRRRNNDYYELEEENEENEVEIGKGVSLLKRSQKHIIKLEQQAANLSSLNKKLLKQVIDLRKEKVKEEQYQAFEGMIDSIE